MLYLATPVRDHLPAAGDDGAVKGTAENDSSLGGRRIRTCGPALRRAALPRRATGIASRSAGESGTPSEGGPKVRIRFKGPAFESPRCCDGAPHHEP
jgi:hypothetical protein